MKKKPRRAGVQLSSEGGRDEDFDEGSSQTMGSSLRDGRGGGKWRRGGAGGVLTHQREASLGRSQGPRRLGRPVDLLEGNTVRYVHLVSSVNGSVSLPSCRVTQPATLNSANARLYARGILRDPRA
jgi:hypothetical protein